MVFPDAVCSQRAGAVHFVLRIRRLPRAQARQYSLRLGSTQPIVEVCGMAGTIARVLVVVFGISYGYDLVRELLYRRRRDAKRRAEKSSR
jgi:hypothetical protein